MEENFPIPYTFPQHLKILNTSWPVTHRSKVLIIWMLVPITGIIYLSKMTKLIFPCACDNTLDSLRSLLPVSTGGTVSRPPNPSTLIFQISDRIKGLRWNSLSTRVLHKSSSKRIGCFLIRHLICVNIGPKRIYTRSEPRRRICWLF